MAKLGVGTRPKRKFKATTDFEHDLPIAQNVLARDFTTTEPDRAWVVDMSDISTTEGWLYLARPNGHRRMDRGILQPTEDTLDD